MNTIFAPTGSSVGAGRRALCAELNRRGIPSELIEIIELMASELLTNAVLHSGTEIRLLLTMDRDRIRVEVEDENPSLPMLRYPPADATSGRGIAIVDALSSRWGVKGMGAGGKSVWFEVSL